jgi:hypothetical protein
LADFGWITVVRMAVGWMAVGRMAVGRMAVGRMNVGWTTVADVGVDVDVAAARPFAG